MSGKISSSHNKKKGQKMFFPPKRQNEAITNLQKKIVRITRAIEKELQKSKREKERKYNLSALRKTLVSEIKKRDAYYHKKNLDMLQRAIESKYPSELVLVKKADDVYTLIRVTRVGRGEIKYPSWICTKENMYDSRYQKPEDIIYHQECFEYIRTKNQDFFQEELDEFLTKISDDPKVKLTWGILCALPTWYRPLVKEGYVLFLNADTMDLEYTNAIALPQRRWAIEIRNEAYQGAHIEGVTDSLGDVVFYPRGEFDPSKSKLEVATQADMDFLNKEVYSKKGTRACHPPRKTRLDPAKLMP